MARVGTSLRGAVRAAVEPFSLEKDSFAAYLKSLNDLPAYDIVSNFQEVMLLFEQDKGESDLLESQIAIIEEFKRKVSALPPESDDLWGNPFDDERWSEIRNFANKLLATL